MTEGFRENLISRGVPPEKVHTIRNGVALDQFDPAESADPAVRARLGATPGRLPGAIRGHPRNLPGPAQDGRRRGTARRTIRSISRSSARARTSPGWNAGSPAWACAT